MNTGEDIYGMRKVLDLSRWISIVLLLLHFYFICYAAFEEWGWTAGLSDRLLEVIARTGVFSSPVVCKLASLLFLGISLPGVSGRKQEKAGYEVGLVMVFVGLGAYFGSILLLGLRGENTRLAMVYMAACFVGWLLILTGGISLSRVMRSALRKSFFRKGEGGFEQEERLIEGPFSINLKARYQLRGEVRDSYINLAGRRGVLLIGSPGSGKSWYVVEPVMEQLISHGFSMLVLDVKYDTLSRYAYTLFCLHRKRYPSSAGFYCINFTDLSRSHRCNLIDPVTMRSLSDAIGVSRTILLSINNTWANKQGDFFVESPIIFLAAVIWWLKKYEGGKFCTLPHVIELAQTPYDKLFPLLNAEPEIQTLVSGFIEAYQNKTFEMLDGQIASARMPLGKLASPEMYYVLTGNDLDLAINNPAQPKILCLGGDPSRQEALAPILSLYIDRLNKLINRPGRHPCALILDEFATVRAASVLQTVAVGRANQIIPLLVIQDLSQLRMLYSHAEADTVMNMTGNLICGQAGGETARWVSERFPPALQYRTTVSVNSSDTSVSKSEQSNPVVSPATIATLSAGEFVGIVADEPGKERPLKAFHGKVLKDRFEGEMKEMPVVREVSITEVEECFKRVKREVVEMVDRDMRRVVG